MDCGKNLKEMQSQNNVSDGNYRNFMTFVLLFLICLQIFLIPQECSYFQYSDMNILDIQSNLGSPPSPSFVAENLSMCSELS